MLQIYILSLFLVTQILCAETAFIPEKDTSTEESYFSDTSHNDVKFPRDQDMHFPEPNGDKMYRTKEGAKWEGKRGNFDISVSIDDMDSHQAEFRAKRGNKSNKDESTKKRKD